MPAMSDPRAALEAIGHLPDGEIDLADAALHLARVDAPLAREGDSNFHRATQEHESRQSSARSPWLRAACNAQGLPTSTPCTPQRWR